MTPVDPSDFYQKPKPIFPHKDKKFSAVRCEKCDTWPAPVNRDDHRLCSACAEEDS